MIILIIWILGFSIVNDISNYIDWKIGKKKEENKKVDDAVAIFFWAMFTLIILTEVVK